MKAVRLDTIGLSATDTDVVAATDSVSAKDSPRDSAGTPPTAHTASRPKSALEPQSMEQAFAVELLHRAAGFEPQQAPTLPEADMAAGAEAGAKADEAAAKEEEAMAARRQQILDDAMDQLFEEQGSKSFSSQARSSGSADLELMDSADSGLLLSASSASWQAPSAGSASEEGGEEFTYTYTYRHSHLEEEEEACQVHRQEDNAGEEAEEKENEEAEKEAEEEEEETTEVQEALAVLSLQGYTGLQRAFLQPLEPASPPALSSTTGPSAGRGKRLSSATPEQALTGSGGVEPRAAAGVATKAEASSTPRLTAPTAAATAAPTAQTVVRPNQQPSNGLPSLAMSKGSRRTVKPTADEAPALLPSHQAANLTCQAAQGREQGSQFSQAEMQSMVDFVFRSGFERMGQLADQSLANPAAEAADVAAPAATVTRVQDMPEMSHDKMQDAFNKLVVHGLQRQGSSSTPRTELAGAALTQAITRATAPPEEIAAAAPATVAPVTAVTRAVAAASTTRLHQDMIDVPQRLVARERVRAAQTIREDEIPRFHSVFSRYDRDRQVREIQELTECQRQVGFAVPAVKQKPSWLKPAFNVLVGIPTVMLATGFARGLKHRRQDFA